MKLKKMGICALTALIGAGICTSITACGGSDIQATTADASRTFNYWVTMTDGTGVGGAYETYEQNPGVLYWTQQDYTYMTAQKQGDTYVQGEEVTNNVALHFEYPATGQEQNSFITTLASGTADILELDYAPETVTKMYQNGKLLDLTWWVENYMPNYKAYVEENGLYNYFTTEIDGERKYLQLYNVRNPGDPPIYNIGYEYRRDWILEYGVDPAEGQTMGQTFAEAHPDWGWTTDAEGNRTWSDGIKFPSYYGYTYTTADNGSATGMGTLEKSAELEEYMKGEYLEEVVGEVRYENLDWEDYEGQWPVTLSDWEWMLDIFQIAIEDLGYTKQGYCMSLYQPGFVNTGNLVSSFGGGGVEWYLNQEGDIVFGGDTETFRTYVEVMSQWYANGWIDENFQSHSDLFWRWDEATVRHGYVGLFYGLDNQLEAFMDVSEGVEANPVNGLYCSAAPFPVNDKYGDDSLKFREPYCFYGLEPIINSIMVTTDAEKNGKDLAALFTFLDNLYTEEAGYVKAAGLSKEMLEESQQGVKDLYEEYNLSEGGWTVDENGNCVQTIAYEALSGDQSMILKPSRLFGYEDTDYPPQGSQLQQYMSQLWGMFDNTGYLNSTFYAQLSPEQYDLYNTQTTSMRNSFISEVPKFIKGKRSMDEWDDWYESMKRSCLIDTVTTMLQALNERLNAE